jgi:hypothetical protein
MISKDHLISVIDSAIQEFRDLGNKLSPRILQQKGTLKQWAVRDDVIHCAYYIRQYADRLAWPRDHEPVDGSDYLKVNDEVWEKHQSESWDEALEMLENACHAVIRGLESLSDEEINSLKTFTWMKGESVARYVPGLIYVHGMMHIQYALMRAGMQDAVIESADKAYQMVEKQDSSEEGRGRNLYNKACSYALAGHKVEAISMVKAAVKLAPNLLEWSKQDSDLDCLRDETSFKAIYQ